MTELRKERDRRLAEQVQRDQRRAQTASSDGNAGLAAVLLRRAAAAQAVREVRPTSPSTADPSAGAMAYVVLDPAKALDPRDLLPNTTYVCDGFKWMTDSNGNVAHVEGQLHLVAGTRHDRLQTKIGHRGRSLLDDGGHLIASRFGGFGSGPNVIPQARGLNRSWGAWYKMEEVWAAALERGERVFVTIDLADEKDAFRPADMIVSFKIGDDYEERTFENEDIEY